MELNERIATYVREHVAVGRRSCPEIVYWASRSDFVGLAGEEELAALAMAAAGPAFAEHLAEQAGWPEVLDNDRLSAAFGDLDRAGIVAREEFTSTISDGRYEIRGEAEGRDDARGFAFYHDQDVASCIAGGVLLVAYGSLRADAGEDDVAEIGREVAAALSAQGLTVDWDGRPQSRIGVKMPWQRRRTGPLAAAPPFPPPADDIESNIDRENWGGPTAPPLGSRSTATFAGAYLPFLPAGASVRIWAGDHADADVRWDGDRLRAEITYWAFPDGPDGEPRTLSLDPVRFDPADAWSVLRRLSERPNV